MNRSVFFAAIRKSLFGGSLKKEQVEGIERILDYWQSHWPAMPIEELAYVLATVRWETGHTFQPIEEGQPTLKGEKLRAYQKALRYWPWYGRGLVQITWQKNYEKYGIIDAAQALEWPTALKVLFDGMIYGRFTGKKLADYISPERQDYVEARRIVNGTDKAATIAGYAVKFLAALKAAEAAPVIEAPPAPSIGEKASSAAKTGGAIIAGAGAGAGAANQLTGGDTAATAIVVVICLVIGGALWAVSKLKRAKAPEPEIEMPAPKPPPPEESEAPMTAIEASPTADLDAAVERYIAARAEVMAERKKLAARLAALKSADEAANTALKDALSATSPDVVQAPPPADPAI